MTHSRAHIHRTSSFGQRAADGIANVMGSWTFIIVQSVLVCGWKHKPRHDMVHARIRLSSALLGLLGPAELAAVLRHEHAHARHRDPLRPMLARSFAAALPFLPLLRELADALPLAQELAADRAVLTQQGARDLVSALLQLDNGYRGQNQIPLAAGMTGSLDARLDQISGQPAAPPAPSPGAVLRTPLVLALGASLLWVTVLAPHPIGSPTKAPELFSTMSWQCAGVVVLAGLACCRLIVGLPKDAARA